MGPVEALRLAVGREEASIKLYRKFAEQFSVAKDVFLFLLDEEEKHKKLLEQKINGLSQ
jgi:rubrerythrin